MRTTASSLFTFAACGYGSGTMPTSEEIGTAWVGFKDVFGKNYHQEEEPRRQEIFRQNFIYMQHENMKGLPYTLGVNQFSDLTRTEYAQRHLGFTHLTEVWGHVTHVGEHDWAGEELADEIDWSQQGAVTPPKDQGQCGSCWAFSTTGALEGAWQVATGDLVSMSEQQLLDCSSANDGCDGGSMPLAFEYASTTGVCTEDSYGYEAEQGSCKSESCDAAIPSGGVTGYKSVKAESEKALMSALQLAPVAVAIEADQMSFQMYQGGILTGECGANLDHGVLAVGYTEDYWLVKNSWGATWGSDGYIKLARGMDDGPGQCGILEMASYPVVSGSNPGPSPAPAPRPAPVPPPPSPSPTPTPPTPYSDCIFQTTEDECRSTQVDGKACSWCFFDQINVGICASPDFQCSAGAAPVETQQRLLPWVAGILAVLTLAFVAVMCFLRRRKTNTSEGEALNISLQEARMEAGTPP